MNAEERRACDGLDDASILETMAWIKEQCILLQFHIEECNGLLGDEKGRGDLSLPLGGSEP